MIELTQLIDKKCTADGYLTLPIEQRVRSRLRVKLDDGSDAGLFLPRGTTLRDGDQLTNEAGVVVEIVAAAEKVITVHCRTPELLARAAYHLGNRHVPLQVESAWLRLQYDHVLDEMLQHMCFETVIELAPFEPEAGAYRQIPQHHKDGYSNSYE